MRKSRFTESQIIAILKAIEAGRAVKDVIEKALTPAETYLLAVFFNIVDEMDAPHMIQRQKR